MTATFTNNKALALAWGALMDEGFAGEAVHVRYKDPAQAETKQSTHSTISQWFHEHFRPKSGRSTQHKVLLPAFGGTLTVEAGERIEVAAAILLRHGGLPSEYVVGAATA